MPAMETLIVLVAGFFLLLAVLWVLSAITLAVTGPLEYLLGVLISWLDRPISLNRASKSTRELFARCAKRLS